MKNGDMPAMPMVADDAKPCVVRDEDTGAIALATGLTKREEFAKAAMQGLLAAGATYNGRTDLRDKLAKDAVAHADALLAELERTAK